MHIGVLFPTGAASVSQILLPRARARETVPKEPLAPAKPVLHFCEINKDNTQRLLKITDSGFSLVP